MISLLVFWSSFADRGKDILRSCVRAFFYVGQDTRPFLRGAKSVTSTREKISQNDKFVKSARLQVSKKPLKTRGFIKEKARLKNALETNHAIKVVVIRNLISFTAEYSVNRQM